MAPRRVILDTDIGTDVDDCLALALLLASPEIELIGISCVYGNVGKRAQIVWKLLELSGNTHIPIYLGAEQTLLGIRKIYWPGHEGVGLVANDAPPAPTAAGHAVDFIIETVLANPGQITILAIGPLTNIGLALRKEPRIAQLLGGLMIMGGAIRGPGQFHLPIAEHNIVCDPEAAQIVFSSAAPIHLVPLDVTTQVQIRLADVERIRAVGTPYHTAVADQVAFYPPFTQRGGSTYLHDPLAAALLIDPSFVTMSAYHVAIETSGRLTAGATIVSTPSDTLPATAQVALSVDPARFEHFLVERLARPIEI
jgi:purine nucleosidase